MERREFLVLSGVASAALIFHGCKNTSSPTVENTTQALLHIPPLLEGTPKEGVMHYDLTLDEATHLFFEGTLTKTFGINGSFLGPTLHVKNGDALSINYTNNLKEATTMHGHGMHVPAVMDGGVHQVIAPQSSWSAVYTVNQRACTNWYHSHLMGKTAEHVYKGLAGLIIVEDEESSILNLPKTYGVDDIPLILQDRFFDRDFELDYSPNRMEIMHGYHGDVFLVNGVVNPYVEVEAKEIRFRILNGSNSTVYDLGFNDGRYFKQIATDNSFLESPVSLTRVLLSPGERAEIIVDYSNEVGHEVVLQEFKQNKTFLTIQVINVQSQKTQLPEVLTRLQKYTLQDAVYTRKFTLSGAMGRFFINGVSMDKEYVNEVLLLHQIEVWEIINEMNVHHNFHMHATHFVVVERNGSYRNVADNEKGYKDTVYVAPRDRVKLIVKMTDYTDTVNPYMYHCHFLEHEDAGMMGQFIVQ